MPSGPNTDAERSRLYRRALARVLAAPVTALVALAALLLWQFSVLLSAYWWVDHTDRVMAQANTVLRFLLDMQAGKRGYLVGGEPLFLREYRDAEARLGPAMTDLQRLVADNPLQQARTRSIQDTYQEWVGITRSDIALFDARVQDFRERYNRGSGKARMDELRRQFDAFLAEEGRLRDERVEAVDRNVRRAFLGGLLVVPLLAGAIILSTRRQILALSADYDEILGAEQRATLDAQARQRRFLKDMLRALTEGRLRLCDTVDELPKPLAPAGDEVRLDRTTLRELRHGVRRAAESVRMAPERWRDLETAVGEAAMNTVVHADGGVGRVCADASKGRVQVWVRDEGRGIGEDALHRATLERGFSSAGTLGHGFWMMLSTCDRVYLLTGAGGTTVVLEQELSPPPPAWMESLGLPSHATPEPMQAIK